MPYLKTGQSLFVSRPGCRNVQKQVCITGTNEFYPVESESNNIRDADSGDYEFKSFYTSPKPFQISQSWGNGDESDCQLKMTPFSGGKS